MTEPTGTKRCIVLAMVCLWAALAFRADAAAAPTTAPSTHPAVPLVYLSGKNLFGARLPPAQEAYVRAEARQWKPKDADVWYIVVPYVSAEECTANVFYTPTQTAPRVRKGQCLDLLLRKNDNLDALLREPVTEQDIRELPRYVQVARAGQRFEDRPGAIPSRPARPVDGPFPAPKARGNQPPLSDEKLAQLVDFARKEFPLYDTDDPFCEVRMGGLNNDEKEATDLFVLCVGIKDEGGGYLVVKSKGDKLEVAGRGGWIDSLFGD